MMVVFKSDENIASRGYEVAVSFLASKCILPEICFRLQTSSNGAALLSFC